MLFASWPDAAKDLSAYIRSTWIVSAESQWLKEDLREDLTMWQEMLDGVIPVPADVADGRTPEEVRHFIEDMIRSYRGEDDHSDYEPSDYSSSDSGSDSAASDDYDLEVSMFY